MSVTSRSRIIVGLAVVFCVLTLTATATAGSTVQVQLTGAGGAEYGLGPNYADGEYLMPYYVSVNGGTPVAVICNDFLHTVSIGDHWAATVSNFSDLSLTRFGNAFATQYHEAAWIASQISASSSLADITGAQFAIWKLFSSGTPVVQGEAQWLAMATVAAANNYYGMNFSHWEVLTPLSPTSPQEYMLYVPDLPEPSVAFDLTVALAGFAGAWNLKRRRVPSKASKH